MNPDDGSYTFEWNDISRTVQWDSTSVEWDNAWAKPSTHVYTPPPTSQPKTTSFPSPIWDEQIIVGPRKHVCVLCGDLDASPICEECRVIFNEFKAYFKKRQFKELMDELHEMDE